jgi:hypothetical protein
VLELVESLDPELVSQQAYNSISAAAATPTTLEGSKQPATAAAAGTTEPAEAGPAASAAAESTGQAVQQSDGDVAGESPACSMYLQQLIEHLKDSSQSQRPDVPDGAYEVLLRASAAVLDRQLHVAQPGVEPPELLVFPTCPGTPLCMWG